MIVPASATAAARWLLLSMLAFALIGMHSLVTVHPADASHTGSGMVSVSAEAVSGYAASAATPIVEQAMAAAESPCCGDHDEAGNHSGSGHGHDLLHLCLAILIALAGLVLGWLLWQRARTTTPHRGPDPGVTSVGRGPPRARPTSALLSLLCVLRL